MIVRPTYLYFTALIGAIFLQKLSSQIFLAVIDFRSFYSYCNRFLDKLWAIYQIFLLRLLLPHLSRGDLVNAFRTQLCGAILAV